MRPASRPVPPRRRKLRERISLGHLFMIAAGLLAFVLVVSVLQDRTRTTRVLVADTDILPGTVITPDLVSEIEVPADSELVGKVATLDTISSGSISAGQRLAAGDPLTITAVAPASSPSTLRAMSLPIERIDAVGGDLSAGDRIDVISVDDDMARYVAVNLEVLATQTPDARSGALGSSSLSTYFVTVSVDDQTALDVALAMETGRVSIVRSTGAEPISPERRQLAGVEREPVAAGGADQDDGTDRG
ncbi:MAG: RcpC/CpaB family pilus assembly protein [Acidimicrobiia bacterium]|nr:RcpC/CpaB family pilus assembly protein [Acidimicrobiia bacterium]